MTKIDLDLAWQQVRRLPTTALEAGVLFRAGLAPITRPQDTITALLNMQRWGMVAGAIRIAAHRDPDALGLVDEIGELTFRQLDERSNALARAWRERRPRRQLGHRRAVPRPPRADRDDVRRRQARREAAADEHRLRQAAVRRGRRARGRRHRSSTTSSSARSSATFPRTSRATSRGSTTTRTSTTTLETLIESASDRGCAPAEVGRRPRAADQRHDRYAEGCVASGQLTVRRRAVPRPSAAAA